MTALVLLTFLLLMQASEAATSTWGVNPSSTNLSTGASWAEGVAPSVMDTNTLVFPYSTATNLNNDLVNAVFGGITFSSGAGLYTIGGNPFTLTGGIINSNAVTETINVPITLGNTTAQTISMSVAASGNLVLGGTLAATNVTLAQNGSGTLQMTGSNSVISQLNLSSGTFLVSAGSTTVTSDGNNQGSTNGSVVVSGGSLIYSGGIRSKNSFLITGGILSAASRFQLAGTAGQTFTMTGGSLTATNQYGIRFGNSSGATYSGGASSAALQTGGSVIGNQFVMGAGTTTGVNSSYTLNGGSLTVTSTASNAFYLQSAGNGATTNVFYLNGGFLSVAGTIAGWSNIAAPGPAQDFVWGGGTLSVGNFNASSLGSSNGSTSFGILANTNGILAPGGVGSSGLTIISGSYLQSAQGVLDIDFGGTIPATSFQSTNAYDTVLVSGSAVLGGSLRYRLLPGFVPDPAQSYPILGAGGGISGCFSNFFGSNRVVSEDGFSSFVLSTNGTNLVLSQYLAVTPPVLSVLPQGTLTVPSGSATLSVQATGGDPALFYQWAFNGSPISGETNPLLVLSSVVSSNCGSYSVTVANSQSFTNSAPVTVGLIPPPVLTLQPLSGSIIAGGSTNLLVAVQSMLPVSCQWSWNGTNIAGATNTLLALSNVALSQAGSYVFSATSPAGTVSTVPVLLTVTPMAVTNLSGAAVVTGGSTTLTAGVQSSTSVTYQWRLNGTNVAGATNPSLTISNVTTTKAGSYSLFLSNSAGTLVTPTVSLLVASPYTNPTILYYPLNSNPVSGVNNVPDASGKTAGTIVGTTNPVLLTNQSGLPGGRAWDFSGTTACIKVPATSSNFISQIGNISNSTGISISFWVNYFFPSIAVANNRFFGVGYGSTVDCQIGGGKGLSPGVAPLQINFGNGNNITQIALATAGYGVSTTNDTVLDGNWHHVVATLDFTTASNNALLYRDGVLMSNATVSEAVTIPFNDTSSNPVYIAARGNGSMPAQGKMAMFGIYSRALTAGEIQALATSTNITNFAPFVSASVDTPLLQWPVNQVGLEGIAVDDGQPAGSSLSYLWTKVSGPGTASFASATSPCTTATFSSPGIYGLRLTASDGSLSGTRDVLVTLATNSPPVVYAGASTLTLAGGGSITLTGGATDDGLPLGASLSYAWKQFSGPASATLATSTSNNTAAILPSVPGTYLFQLACSDSQLTGSNWVAVKVVSSLPPVVTAYASAPVINFASTNALLLSGSASSSGGVALTYLWTQVSGDGMATFASSTSSNTAVTLSSPGTYDLRLTVSDGTNSSSSDVWVQAWASSPGASPPFGRATNSANPAPYVHPRIFFTEADRPSLLAATTDTNNPVVTNAIAILRSNVSNSVYNPSNPYGQAYAQLLAGNTNYDIRPIVTQGSFPYYTLSGYSNQNFYEALEAACYLAWVDHANPANQQLLTNLATVVANAAAQHTSWYLADREANSGSTNPADYSVFSYDVYSNLALCYDLMYNWMTESQRGVTRSLLAWMTAGRHTWGVGEPDPYHSTNWRTFHDHLIIAQLAIEGETGWDPVAISDNLNSLKVFTQHWGISAEGINREGPGYFDFGMRNGGVAAYALSRRYEDLLTTTRMYVSLQEMIYELKPDASGVMFGMNDGIGWSSDTTYFLMLKAAFPNDPMADWVYRMNILGNPSNVPLARAIFGRPYLAGNTSFKAMASAKGMPLALFSPQRGVGETRSDWSTNALTFNFEARPDAMDLGHMHSMINSFSLHALARDWFLGQGYDWSANDIQQTILIDGVAQAATTITLQTNNPAFGTNYTSFWPSLPGRTVEVVNQPKLTLFCGDATSAYTYSWSQGQTDNNLPNNTNTVKNSVNTPWRWKDMFYPGFTPPTPSVGDNTWLEDTIIADNVLYNPVSRAFRTLVMIRGSDPDVATYPRPYTLVLDDIQKSYSNNIPAFSTNGGGGLDTNPHTFTWSADTVSGISPTGDWMMITNATTTNAILFHNFDSNTSPRPQLLVQVISANGTAPGPLSMDATQVYQGGAYLPLNRLLITRSNTVAPDFRILLYPHLNGEPTPKTTYTNWVSNGVTNATLTINVPTNASGGTVTDVFQLQTTTNGRTRVISYTRGGATPPALTVPSAVTATTSSNSAIVNFSVSAVDSSNKALVPTVTPASGSSFPIGTTQVSVSAADSNGNTATAIFNVTVTPLTPPPPWSVAQMGSITAGSAQGSVTYDSNSGTYSVIGRGGAIGTTDSGTEALMSWTNGGIFSARIASVSCADSNALAFLTVRASTNAGDPAVFTGVTPVGIGQFLSRSSTNGSSSAWSTNGAFTPVWVRLIRNGTNVSGFLSPDGLSWSQLGPVTSSGTLSSNAAVVVGVGAAPNTAGYTCYATFDHVSAIPAPAALTGLASSNGVSQVSLFWNSVAGADGYVVQRSLSSNGPFGTIAVVSGTSSFSDTNPPAGQPCWYQVWATNAAGAGSFGVPISGGLMPAVPTGVTAATSGSPAQVAITWSASGTTASFSVKRSTISGGPYISLAQGLSSASYIDTGVTPGIVYFYVVTASNGVGESSPSAEVQALPPTALQSWRQQWFGITDNVGMAADAASPAGDGIPNLMKYALGLNPLVNCSTSRPYAVLTNGCLEMDFTMISDPLLTYGVEVSGDLTSWTNIWNSTGTANSNGPVSVRDTNAPVLSTPRRFLRLRVTAP